jgi:hypothetical protein
MIIYLVGDQGGRTAFKITTAHVLTDLDSIMDELLERSIQVYKGYYGSLPHIKDVILNKPSRYNIYYAELDDLGNTAKKLTGEAWRRVVETYVSRHKAEVIEANKKRNKLIREEGED